MSEKVADWSHLPHELLEKIAGTLDEIADRVRFGAVCKPWRSASRSPRLPLVRLPWLLLGSGYLKLASLFHGKKEDDDVQRFLSLSDHKTYALDLPATRDRVYFGSAYGWLLVTDYSKTDSLLLLLNPINGSQISLPPFPLQGDTVDHFKLIRSAEKFVVMVITFTNRLIYCLQLGEVVDIAAARWSKIQVVDPEERASYRSDYTYHGGCYFVIGENEDGTFVFDANTCLVVAVLPSVARGLPFSHLEMRRQNITFHDQYLVNSPNGDDLFLVISPSKNKQNAFEVFKLDCTEEHPAKWKWSKVTNIGCNVVFVHDVTKTAMILPVSGFGGVRGNCIVFYDRRQEDDDHFSLFDIENNRVEQLAGSWDAKLRIWVNQGWFAPSLQVKELTLG